MIMRFCKKCGNRLGTFDIKCTNCGHRVSFKKLKERIEVIIGLITVVYSGGLIANAVFLKSHPSYVYVITIVYGLLFLTASIFGAILGFKRLKKEKNKYTIPGIVLCIIGALSSLAPAILINL